jgi:cell wall-associated NlpC family hydrolase
MVKLHGLLGVKFAEGGRSINSGLDCWGLVMEIFGRYGIEISDFGNNIPKLKGKWEEVYDHCDNDAPLVVLIKTHPVIIDHAGVFVGRNKIMHTTKGTGVIISREDALKSRIMGYYKPC